MSVSTHPVGLPARPLLGEPFSLHEPRNGAWAWDTQAQSRLHPSGLAGPWGDSRPPPPPEVRGSSTLCPQRGSGSHHCQEEVTVSDAD